MARNIAPIAKRCRELGISPAVMGYAKKTSTRNPGSAMRKKKSEYATQLNEKQKVKFIYGIQEKQFETIYEKAEKMPGQTGVNILQLVERRLDNVVYRMGFATTRRDSRQLVTHGHFTVNGKSVDVPSYTVKVGDVVAVKDTFKSSEKAKSLAENMETAIVPKWLEVDAENLTAKVIANPAREEIDYEVEEQLIVELYSK